MLRTILGVVVGIVVGIAVVSGVEFLSHQIYPLPPGFDPMDPEALKAIVAAMPLGALIMVLVGHTLGAFAGVAAGLLVAQRRPLAGWIVGAVFLAATILNLFMIPSPAWFVAADLALAVAGALVGLRLFGRRAVV